MNPIVNQLFQNALGGNNIFNIFKSVKNSNNPMGMLQSLSGNNPQLQQVLQLVSQNGGDAKSLFYKMAQQKGVDPNTIINQLNNS